MDENTRNEQVQTENNSKKANRKKMTIKPVTQIKVSKKAGLKLGCFGDPYIVQSFMSFILKGTSDEVYTEFFKEHVISQKEMDDFKEALASCEEIIA